MKSTFASTMAAKFLYETSLESPTTNKCCSPAIDLSASMAGTTWATSPAPPS